MDVLRTGLLGPRGGRARRSRAHGTAGARAIADRLIVSFSSMLLYWHHFARRRAADRDRDRRAHACGPLPQAAPRPAGVRGTRPRAGPRSHPLRGARVQRLDLHGPRDRRNGLGPPLGDLRRDRSAARPEARGGQRGRDRDRPALRERGRGRGRHPRARGLRRDHHRLRAPRLHDSDPRSPIIKEVARALCATAGSPACSRSASASRP